MESNKTVDRTNITSQRSEVCYATFSGFTRDKIKEIVDSVFGSVIWERDVRNACKVSTCYPDGKGEVAIYDK